MYTSRWDLCCKDFMRDTKATSQKDCLVELPGRTSRLPGRTPGEEDSQGGRPTPKEDSK